MRKHPPVSSNVRGGDGARINLPNMFQQLQITISNYTIIVTKPVSAQARDGERAPASKLVTRSLISGPRLWRFIFSPVPYVAIVDLVYTPIPSSCRCITLGVGTSLNPPGIFVLTFPTTHTHSMNWHVYFVIVYLYNIDSTCLWVCVRFEYYVLDLICFIGG